MKIICPECYSPFFVTVDGSDLVICTTCRAAFPPDSDLIFEDPEPLLPMPRSLAWALVIVFAVLATIAVIISNLPDSAAMPLWYTYGGN